MIGPGGCPGTGHCEDYLGTRGHGGTIYSARWSVVCQVVGAVVAGPGRAHSSPQNLLPVCSLHSPAQATTWAPPSPAPGPGPLVRGGGLRHHRDSPRVDSVDGVDSVDRGSPHVDTGISWSHRAQAAAQLSSWPRLSSLSLRARASQAASSSIHREYWGTVNTGDREITPRS